MSRIFANRAKTIFAAGCSHVIDTSPGNKYSCIYRPISTVCSLPKKLLHLFPEVYTLLHKGKNSRKVCATIENSNKSCGRFSHYGESSNEVSGRFSHYGESSNEVSGRFSHYGESSNEVSGRLSHIGESPNETSGSFSPIREQNYGYISLKV